jgi:hypothetical protein
MDGDFRGILMRTTQSRNQEIIGIKLKFGKSNVTHKLKKLQRISKYESHDKGPSDSHNDRKKRDTEYNAHIKNYGDMFEVSKCKPELQHLTNRLYYNNITVEKVMTVERQINHTKKDLTVSRVGINEVVAEFSDYLNDVLCDLKTKNIVNKKKVISAIKETKHQIGIIQVKRGKITQQLDIDDPVIKHVLKTKLIDLKDKFSRLISNFRRCRKFIIQESNRNISMSEMVKEIGMERSIPMIFECSIKTNNQLKKIGEFIDKVLIKYDMGNTN